MCIASFLNIALFILLTSGTELQASSDANKESDEVTFINKKILNPNYLEYSRSLQFFRSKDKNARLLRVKRQDTTLPVSDATTVPATAAPSSDTVPVSSDTPAPPAGPNLGTPGFECPIEFYQRYGTVCCKIPPMIEDKEYQKCIQRAVPIPVTVYKGVLYKLRFKGPMSTRNSSIVTPTSQIIDKTNTIDSTLLLQTMSIYMPTTYSDILRNSVIECGYIASSDPLAAVTNANGATCLLAPTKMLRCMKRYMMLNCPQAAVVKNSRNAKDCSLDVLKLNKCDTSLL